MKSIRLAIVGIPIAQVLCSFLIISVFLNRPENADWIVAALAVLQLFLSVTLVLNLKARSISKDSHDASMNSSIPADQINLLIKHAADVICLIDTNCNLLQVNPASSVVWGYQPEELIGHNMKEFLESDDDIRATLKAVAGTENSVDQLQFENRFKHKSGRAVDMLWSARWSVSDHGLFCVAHNISERKRAEQRLKESENRLASILEFLPAGVLLIAKNGCLEFMNHRATQLVGYGKDFDFTEIRASKLLSICKEPYFIKQFDELFEKCKTSSIEGLIRKANGEEFPADISLCEIRIHDHESCLVIFLDASIKHELERAKREFVAMVSHDLRTPLTSMQFALNMALDGTFGELPEEAITELATAENCGTRLLKLVNDLLDLEKIESGIYELHKSSTALSKIVQSSIAAVEPIAQHSQIKIKTQLSDCEVFVDDFRIEQVLVNLLSNALKFSKAGSQIEIIGAQNAGIVELKVIDSGTGIPKELHQSIFDRFRQADGTYENRLKGTGLGLAICKSIIEAHQGRIGVESEPGKGSTFWFQLQTGQG